MSSYQPRKKKSALGPLLGFILLIGILGISFLLSSTIVDWLQTTQFELGALGPVLPIEFPADWPPIVAQIIVTLAVSVIAFTILMPLTFLFVKTPKDELDVSLTEVRDRKKDKQY